MGGTTRFYIPHASAGKEIKGTWLGRWVNAPAAGSLSR
jgi:hypothetical protein